MDVFDLAGPLPRGTALLEASAGTGKTYAIGALVTRYVAEGVVPLDQMLVVTFGRAATQELRDRVRGALLGAERSFAAALAGRDTSPVDAVLAALLDVDDAERVARHRRLADALAAFDHATIATIHQFCQLVLRSLGVAGDTEPGAELVESLAELTVEVVDDLYLLRYGSATEPPPFDRACALRVATAAVEDPRATLADADPADAVGSARVAFAHEVRTEMERRKRRLGILSYDDLLGRLADALDPASADGGSAVGARMRERWKVVLVDEFQDTDPVQWQVLERAFGVGQPEVARQSEVAGQPEGRAQAMVLVGDPKQAIYAFRGGDVVAYLDAARGATTRATLGTNWRSDAPLVDTLGVLLAGAALGHDEIVVHPVTAESAGSRLAGAPHPAPFRLRQVLRDGLPKVKGSLVQVGAARQHVAADLAADVAELLAAGATWDGRPLVAGDVAVLVSARAHGRLVQDTLAERGVAAVMSGGDVFATPAADEWLTLLEALESPHRSGLVRAAALTCFLGRTAADLDAGGEDLTARDADTLHGWALLARHRGVAALLEAAEERGLSGRLLAQTEGERLLTDVRHLGQLLHDLSVTESLGLTALVAWFRDERRRTGTTERPRRLDSDAAAVQIVTVHGSKGLQYPVVYLPFGYDNYSRPVEIALYHDERGARTIDVSGSGAHWDAHGARHRAEEDGEELRKLYVALTRARSQVVAWWAPTSSTPTSGLHRLVFGRVPGTREVPGTQPVKDDAYVTRVLRLLEELGGPAAELAVPAAASAPAPASRHVPFEARTFDRAVDTAWRRTSYSGLIQPADGAPSADGPGVSSEPEAAGTDDEPGTPEAEDEESVAPDAAESPMADLPRGAAFGSLVHAVLEDADPFAPDLRGELLGHVTEQLRWWPVPADPEALADGLVPLHRTPLGPLADGLTLGEIGLPDRLRELTFELPLSGGDLRGPGRPGGAGRAEVRLGDLGPLLRAHLLTDDPLAAYADRLGQPALGDQPLRGYLTGSIDAVLRLPTGRFLVVDYKTNFLGRAVADYSRPRMAEAMLHSHYPLQALLYGVALHRYLRWRLAGYDPDTHLGGALYLFVRGMAGPDSPDADGSPAGVFSWRTPAALLVALSDLLDGVAGQDAA
ncbi:DNA helicase/exodeoxyribonuclease V, beta subunit (EC 3.1.11.5) [Promicromonospora umidemergens]|uniref:RecBCD enzyme subunit RecB n=1 Tax=Promicromonospora umidemergens TaxID=629679 RepID=A0ABP8XLN8_9MICO|nr:UvrD-helicase domain-containing protein [Promicromonospora umidemergens]MCP2282016.1 DNA helicase/exodeoxyribonuclease V, beta subunit (EC 3.1.11.5) [Promicromonospora umidemergens]